jgi:sulfur-oxidizing protein SoxZ
VPRTFIRLPQQARRGEIIEIKAMIEHPNHSGFRVDLVGKAVPRNIVETFTCNYGGQEVFHAALYPAIATNPYLSFFVIARDSGELELTWTDDRGVVVKERATLTVV